MPHNLGFSTEKSVNKSYFLPLFSFKEYLGKGTISAVLGWGDTHGSVFSGCSLWCLGDYVMLRIRPRHTFNHMSCLSGSNSLITICSQLKIKDLISRSVLGMIQEGLVQNVELVFTTITIPCFHSCNESKGKKQ